MKSRQHAAAAGAVLLFGTITTLLLVAATLASALDASSKLDVLAMIAMVYGVGLALVLADGGGS